MKTRLLAATLLVALVPHLAPSVALAQTARADDPVTVQARARFKEGVDYFDKGQYESARISFLQAYALRKHPAVLLNLAQSSAKANHPLEASRYFQQFLREAGTVTPQQQKDAESGLAEVRQKLGRVEIVAPAGTEIILDDKDRLGTAPFPDAVDVEPGAHNLKSPTETVRVTAPAGQKVQATFGQPATAPAPVVAPVPPPTKPAAEAPAATTAPVVTEPPPPVKHTDILSPPENMLPVYVGLAAGGVGLASAILFAVFKSDAQSEADQGVMNIRAAAADRGLPAQGICSSTNPAVQQDFSSACETLQSNNDKVDTNATIANVSLVVMGVGLATAAGWYLFAPKRGEGDQSTTQGAAPKPSFGFAPYGGYGRGGLALSGSF